MKKLTFCILVLTASTAFVADNVDVIATLRQRLKIFNDTYSRAKIDMFFNQDEYSPGDTALIRVAHVESFDLRPVQGREVVNIELYDQDGKIELSSHLVAVNGLAIAALALPMEVKPGIHMIVAYTEWMRNLGPDLFYKREIIISGSKAFQPGGANSSDIHVIFYPEGGKLISGVENNLVIRVTGGHDLQAIKLRGDDTEVFQAAIDRNGLAEIKFTPQGDKKYFAEITTESNPKRFELPRSESGFAMESTIHTDGIHLRVLRSPETDLSNQYFLVLANRQGILLHSRLDTKENKTEITVPQDLPAGVAQFSIINSQLMVLANRPIYIAEKSVAIVKVNPSSTAYSTRQNASIDVEVKDGLGHPMQGYFSARITNQIFLRDTVRNMDIASSLKYYSDLSTTFRLRTTDDSQELNKYFVTQTCPWLNWERILSDDLKPQFIPSSNIVLQGKVVYADSGEPVPDSTQVMFFVEKQLLGYESLILNDGKFRVPLMFDFHGNDKVFFVASRKGKDINNIEVKLNTNDVPYVFQPQPWKASGKEDAYNQYNLQKRLIDNSFRFFSKKINPDSVSDPNGYFDKTLQADITFRTSDFVIFPNMEELIREVLKGVDYRKMKGKDVVRVYTSDKLPTSYATPMYVIDGVITKETSVFLNLKPSEIITIKIIKNSAKLKRFGILGANGIIIVRTSNPNLADKIRPESEFEVSGMLPPTKGYGQLFLAKNAQTPDLRSCLDFKPVVTLNEGGIGHIDFRTSDDTGFFKIRIEGITTGGIPFFKEEVISVKFP